MDPITAGFEAFKAFCDLLATPQGQIVMSDTNNALHGVAVGIATFFHNHFQQHTTAQQTSTESNSTPPQK